MITKFVHMLRTDPAITVSPHYIWDILVYSSKASISSTTISIYFGTIFPMFLFLTLLLYLVTAMNSYSRSNGSSKQYSMSLTGLKAFLPSTRGMSRFTLSLKWSQPCHPILPSRWLQSPLSSLVRSALPALPALTGSNLHSPVLSSHSISPSSVFLHITFFFQYLTYISALPNWFFK